MRFIDIIVVTAGMLLCGCNSCERKPGHVSGTDTTVAIVNTPDTLPEWVVADSSFMVGYVSYSSKDMPLDISEDTNIYPFVVGDSNGNMCMFILLTTRGYDKVGISQMSISDDDGYFVNTSSGTLIRNDGVAESNLFGIDSAGAVFMSDMKPELKANVWGPFGSFTIALGYNESVSLIRVAGFASGQR